MDRSKRDKYLKRTYGISIGEWDFICGFYGNRCLYPGCGFLGDAYTLSVDHVYPDHLGGKSEISNYQPLCEYHNLYVKNGKYQEFRFDKGKKVLKSLVKHRGNQSSQLCLAFPVASVNFKNIDKPQIQPDFFYVLSDKRKREVWELERFVNEIRDPDNWADRYVHWDIVEDAYKRVDRILKRQETFYVSEITGEPLGIKKELNWLAWRSDPNYFDLLIEYDAINVWWAKKVNEVNQTDFTPRQIYWAHAELVGFSDIEFEIEKLKICKQDEAGRKRAWLLAGLIWDKMVRFRNLIENNIRRWGDMSVLSSLEYQRAIDRCPYA